jgi:hypothetical protein
MDRAPALRLLRSNREMPENGYVLRVPAVDGIVMYTA